MQVSERNGSLVSAVQTFEGDEMMLISDKGTLVRSRTEEVSVLGRNTQGVRLIKLTQEGERLVAVERIEEPESEELDDEGVEEGAVQAESSENDSPSDSTDGDTLQ
jgi:DNA gyrase subunit A